MAVRLGVIAVPLPLAPTVSTKYSAPSMVPPAMLSSPVAEMATSMVPLAGVGVALPLVVCGPVLGRLKITAPTTPQLPALSRARTNTVCLPAGSAVKVVCGIVPLAPTTFTAGEGVHRDAEAGGEAGRAGVVDDDLGTVDVRATGGGVAEVSSHGDGAQTV